MSRLLAVTARELRERWLLFPGAFVAGFFPLVVPAFGVSREFTPVMGAAGTVLLGAAVAVVMGTSMLARDTADGRLGFLFSRPLAWGTIWGGKWLAALVLVASSAFLCAIPWMVAVPMSSLGGRHGDSWLRAILDGPGAAPLFLLFVLTVGVANLGATALRSRSPWVALDLVLLLVAFWATRRYVAPFWLYDIAGKGKAPVVLALLPLALGMLLGSVAQVAVGRTDLRRAHRAVSFGFWAVTGLALAGAAGYWQWVRSAGPDGVRVHAVSRDHAGRWLYVEGSGPHSGWYPLAFLIDTTTGRHLARPGPATDLERWVFGMLFSADGRFGALPGAAHAGAALELFDLREPMPRVSAVALEASAPPNGNTLFELSPSGASVFVASESGASLFALPSGRRVATTPIAPGWRPAAVRFPAEGAARAWLVPSHDASGARRARAEMRVVDLAADGAASGTTFPIAAVIDPLVRSRAVLPDASGRRILTWEAGLRLRDGATGEPIASLVPGQGAIPALFLADGRVVVEGRAAAGEPLPAHPRLWVFDPGGTRLADVELPLPGCPLGLGPEVAPGRVAVSCPYYGSFPSKETLVVDLASAQVVARVPGLVPGLLQMRAAHVAGPPSSVHFFSTDEGQTGIHPARREHGVVRIDFATGERRLVAGPGAAPGERISAR